jgi:hypothetical protein
MAVVEGPRTNEDLVGQTGGSRRQPNAKPDDEDYHNRKAGAT